MRDHARDKIYLKIRPALDVGYPAGLFYREKAGKRVREMLGKLPGSTRSYFDRKAVITDLPGRDWHNFSVPVLNFPVDFYNSRKHLDAAWAVQHNLLLALGREIRRADSLATVRPCPWVDYQEEAWRPGWMTSFLLDAVKGRKLRLNKLEPLTQRLGMDIPLAEREQAQA